MFIRRRELEILAGTSGVIHLANCDEAGPLLQILGYRLRQGCGHKGSVLITAEPERAFLTSDSGFPLTDLEEALENNTPFTYAFHASQVPVLFKETDWTRLAAQKRKVPETVLDALLHDPSSRSSLLGARPNGSRNGARSWSRRWGSGDCFPTAESSISMGVRSASGKDE